MATAVKDKTVTYTQEQLATVDEFVGRIRQWAHMGAMDAGVDMRGALKLIHTEVTNLEMALRQGVIG